MAAGIQSLRARPLLDLTEHEIANEEVFEWGSFDAHRWGSVSVTVNTDAAVDVTVAYSMSVDGSDSLDSLSVIRRLDAGAHEWTVVPRGRHCSITIENNSGGTATVSGVVVCHEGREETAAHLSPLGDEAISETVTGSGTYTSAYFETLHFATVDVHILAAGACTVTARFAHAPDELATTDVTQDLVLAAAGNAHAAFPVQGRYCQLLVTDTSTSDNAIELDVRMHGSMQQRALTAATDTVTVVQDDETALLATVTPAAGTTWSVQSNDTYVASENTLASMSAKLDGDLSVSSNGQYIATETTLAAVDAKLGGSLTVEATALDVRPLTNADVVTVEQGSTWTVVTDSQVIATENTLQSIDSRLAGTLTVQSGGDLSVASNGVYVASESTVASIDSKLGGTLTVQATELDIRPLTAVDVVTVAQPVPSALQATVQQSGTWACQGPVMNAAYASAAVNTAQYPIAFECYLYGVYISLGENTYHSIFALYDATSEVTSASTPVLVLPIKGVNQQYIKFPGPIHFTTGVAVRGVRAEDPAGATSMNSTNGISFFYTTV